MQGDCFLSVSLKEIVAMLVTGMSSPEMGSWW